MNNQKYHFNNKDLQKKPNFINNSILPKNSRNNEQYLNKSNNKFSFINYNNLNLNQNNFISTEQSTLLSTEDLLLKNNILSNINNCNCYCHEIDKKIITNIFNIQKENCNCPCHYHNKLIISCPNYPHIHYIHHKKINLKNNNNRLCRSVGDITNRNIYLFDKYKGLNQKYNDIKEQLEYLELDEKQRNNYIKQLENKLSFSSNNIYNYFPKEIYRFRNRSNDDIKIDQDEYNNYYNYTLLEKTRMILNSSSFRNKI